MKKLFAIAVAAVISLSASAQITYNAKIGGGFSSCIISDDAGSDNLDSRFVGKVGVGIEYPLTSNFSLMPSLEFALKGAKSGDTSLGLYYAQVPVLGAYRFNLNDKLNFAVKAGPYFAYGIAGSDNIFDEDAAKRFEMGIDAGFDFEFQRFVVGVEYEVGLTNMFEFHDNWGNFSAKNQAFYLTVGYKF